MITSFLTDAEPDLLRVGLETGPLAVWLWNELASRRLPVLCIDARHANAALKMRPVKTDRNDAVGLASRLPRLCLSGFLCRCHRSGPSFFGAKLA